MKSPRLLFVSPCLPYPKAAPADDHIDYFYYRNTLDQGLFQLRQMHSWHPLHYLAQNLPVDSVVLENPTVKQFHREVETGAYDVVAISFTLVLAAKLLDMVTWLKEEHPDIEIVVGGYGVSIFDERRGIEAEIEQRVDQICRGEGLVFMRDYLRLRWGVQARLPHRQDLIPSTNSLYGTRLSLYRQLAVVGSLGCKNGCVFCATSAHFSRQHLPVAEGRALYELLKKQVQDHPDAQSAIIYSENFLQHREAVLEFSRFVQADREMARRPVLLTVFSSAREVQRYSVEELLRCNIGTIFIGVESLRRDILKSEGLDKRGEGDLGGLFERLHDVGINTLGSMIIGWDRHSPEMAVAELRGFEQLNPTFYQIVPLHPVPGTPLWKKIVSEDRLIKGYRYQDDGAGRSNFYYRHLDGDQVEGWVRDSYRRLVDQGGAWPVRLVLNLWRGMSHLKNRDEEDLRGRGQAYERMMWRLLPLAVASWLLVPGAYRRAFLDGLRGSARHRFWRTTLGAVLGGALVPALTTVYGFARLRQWLRPLGDQPRTLRREYPQANGVAKRREVLSPGDAEREQYLGQVVEREAPEPKEQRGADKALARDRQVA